MIKSFVKMHGLGNDFVILDHRQETYPVTFQDIQKISHRRFGIGCDQLILLEKASSPQANIFMRIYNADGAEVGACGNATRCVGSLLTEENGNPEHLIETQAGLLGTHVLEKNLVTLDLGKPRFQWQEIPLSQEMDTLHIPLSFEGLKNPAALSLGNPHLVFFVYDVESIDLLRTGASLTHHPFFPEGINVEIVEKVDDTTLRMRVYERGAGITLACGTGAAASVIAARKRGILAQNPVTVLLDGGVLKVDYQETVKITGQVTLSFRGVFNPDILQD